MHIVELDFGMGNIRSLEKALVHIGAKVEVTSSKSSLLKADALVLPGDGAFGAAMQELKKRELIEPIQKFYESGRPILGICIGFQILFSQSNELGLEKGLGFLNGSITRFNEEHNGKRLMVPHIGWEKVSFTKESALGKNLPSNAWFYFVHSYRHIPLRTDAFVSGIANHGEEFTAAIENNNLFGVQFHPEKSHGTGLKFLENFLEYAKKNS